MTQSFLFPVLLLVIPCFTCLNADYTSFEMLLLQYFTGLECGHKFCMQCWGDYLTTKIIEEGMGQVPPRDGTVHGKKI